MFSAQLPGGLLKRGPPGVGRRLASVVWISWFLAGLIYAFSVASPLLVFRFRTFAPVSARAPNYCYSVCFRARLFFSADKTLFNIPSQPEM
jgi:hypothetical protein